MSLDDRLGAILQIYRDATPHPYAQKVWIAQIHRAFADEGYEKRTLGRDFTARVNLKEVMTGQEWYARFNNALRLNNKLTVDKGGDTIVEYDYIEAAKEASGL